MIIGYRNTTEGALGRSTVKDAGTLLRLIEARTDVDYEAFAPGSSTVLAELRWSSDGEASFHGLTGAHVLADTGGEGYARRVAAHWDGFAEAQRVRNEADKARFRSAAPEAGLHHSYAVMDSLHVIRDAHHLRETMPFCRSMDYGRHGADGTLDERIATFRTEEGGLVAFESDHAYETLPAGTRPEVLAERWEGFVARALELAGPSEDQGAPAPGR